MLTDHFYTFLFVYSNLGPCLVEWLIVLPRCKSPCKSFVVYKCFLPVPGSPFSQQCANLKKFSFNL